MWGPTRVRAWAPAIRCIYISSTCNIAVQFGVGHHQYADDTQMSVALSPTDINTSISNLQNCLTVMHLWFSQNGLVINSDESEAVLFSTAQRTRKSLTAIKQVDVACCPVLISNNVKILGVTLDQHLTFNDHVQHVCKSALYYTRALQHIRSSSTADMAKLLQAH